MVEADLFKTIFTLRAVREFEPKDVDDDEIRLILKAATMAPSGSNTQPWEFIVVKDRAIKERLKKPLSEGWHHLVKSRFIKAGLKKMYEAATRMVDNTDKVPVLIFVCIDLRRASRTVEVRYASIYPAVQNLLLSAWALGLGTCLTSHASTKSRGEDEVKQILDIPEHVKIAATIYLGYPAVKLGPPRRISVEDVLHWNRW